MDVRPSVQDNLALKTKAEIKNLCVQFNIPIHNASVSNVCQYLRIMSSFPARSKVSLLR